MESARSFEEIGRDMEMHLDSLQRHLDQLWWCWAALCVVVFVAGIGAVVSAWKSRGTDGV